MKSTICKCGKYKTDFAKMCKGCYEIETFLAVVAKECVVCGKFCFGPHFPNKRSVMCKYRRGHGLP